MTARYKTHKVNHRSMVEFDVSTTWAAGWSARKLAKLDYPAVLDHPRPSAAKPEGLLGFKRNSHWIEARGITLDPGRTVRRAKVLRDPYPCGPYAVHLSPIPFHPSTDDWTFVKESKITDAVRAETVYVGAMRSYGCHDCDSGYWMGRQGAPGHFRTVQSKWYGKSYTLVAKVTIKLWTPGTRVDLFSGFSTWQSDLALAIWKKLGVEVKYL